MQRLYGLIFTTILLMLGISAMSQNSRNISVAGTVTDESNTPVEAATVMLISQQDSTLVSGDVTDKSGTFTVHSGHHGKYLLKISFVGYRTYTDSLVLKRGESIRQLGNIILKTDSKILAETVVTAEAPPVVVKGDTISYNAAAIRLNEGAILADLIKKIPGAELSADGKITINGKEITQLMIDGKEFFTDNPNIALNNLPANIVKDVKTYDRKSDMTRVTGIDDGEENNVLDVTIKEGMKKGWFGNIIVGAGNKQKYEGGAMMNRFRGDMQVSFIGSANNTNGQGFNDISDADIGAGGRSPYGESETQTAGINFSLDKEKIEIHADASYTHDKMNVYRNISRETFHTEGSSFDNKKSDDISMDHELFGAVRLRWRPDSLTEIHLNQHFNYTNGKENSELYSHTLNNVLDSVNKGTSFNDYKNMNHSLNGDIMINRRFRKKGRNLTLRMSYRKGYNRSDDLTLSNTFFFATDSNSLINRLTQNGGDNLDYDIHLAYSEPLWKDAYLRISYRYNNTASSSYRTPIYDLSTQPMLDEVINDTYSNNKKHTMEAILQNTIRKINYNIGIGLVPIISHTRVDQGINAGLDKTHVNFNYQPTASLVWRFDNRRQLRLSYRGQSSIPSILDLQEIKDISDPMNLKFGNPNLKNSFINRYTLSYSGYNADRGSSIMTFITASNTINGITQRTSYDPQTGVRSTRSENINGNWNINSYYSFSSPLRNKKYTMGTDGNISYSHRVGYSSLMNDNAESAISISNNVMAGGKVYATYRNDVFDCNLAVNFNTNISKNNLNDFNDRTTYSFGSTANANVNLPWDMVFSTDIRYNALRGYSDGFDNDYVIWNAQVSKNFLKYKQATIRIKMYDILQSQSNTYRTMGFDYTQDSETNMVGSYFIVHFIYRLNSMNRSAKRRPHPGPPPPPRSIRMRNT